MPKVSVWTATFRQLERWLREEFPIEETVRVKLVSKMPGGEPLLQGFCVQRDDGSITISILRKMSVSEQKETLMHEWTHARVERETEEHPDEFWIEFGRIYRAYFHRGGWEKAASL